MKTTAKLTMLVAIFATAFPSAGLFPLQLGTITVSFSTGPAYTHTKWFGIIPVKLTPQIAVWLEDANGSYVQELFVTKRSATSDWAGGNDICRPEALPVWSHSRGLRAQNGSFMPSKNTPLPDAVSGATPQKDFSISVNILPTLRSGIYIVKAEINSSFDYNATYAEKLSKESPYYNGVNGQPSLVYAARLEIGGVDSTVRLSLQGHGDVLGRNGSIDTNISGITDALSMIESITVTYRN